MPITLAECSQMLSAEGVRHHIDAQQGVIRAVFVTRLYHNLRGERLAVMQIETPDHGQRFRIVIPRAFAVEGDIAAACLTACRLAADTPLVGIEYDADFEDLRMVVEAAVNDGELTSQQVLSMVDQLVAAVDVWGCAMPTAKPKPRKRRAA
jgi:hypothetical protein